MKRRYVYVIGCGERSEGIGPVAATETLVQARREVFRRYDVAVCKVGPGQWMATIEGCDEAWIYRLPLAGAR
jgi:hypothetical protein